MLEETGLSIPQASRSRTLRYWRASMRGPELRSTGLLTWRGGGLWCIGRRATGYMAMRHLTGWVKASIRCRRNNPSQFEKDATTNCAFGGKGLKTPFTTAGNRLWASLSIHRAESARSGGSKKKAGPPQPSSALPHSCNIEDPSVRAHRERHAPDAHRRYCRSSPPVSEMPGRQTGTQSRSPPQAE